MGKETKGQVDEALKFIDEMDTAEGFEQMTQETMSIPFLRLLQPLSPQINKQENTYVEGAEAGMFLNTVTKQLHATVQCIVLKYEHMYIEWRPNRGGFVGYHTPENAERIATQKTFGDWKTEDGNILQENYVYFLLIIGHEKEGPVVFSCAVTQLKRAKDWNRLMQTHVLPNGKKALPYYLVWNLSTEYTSNEKGSWFLFKPVYSGYIDEEQYRLTKQERVLLPQRQVDYALLEANTSTKEVDESSVDY